MQTRRVLTALAAAALLAPLAGLVAPAGAATETRAAPGPGAGTVGPNGEIAFADYEFCCDYDIYTVNPDGSGLTNLTNTPGISETGPSWSPGGTQLAFSSNNSVDGTSDLWVMDADGGNPVNLTQSPEPDFQADWAPDGSRLVFTRQVPGESISIQFDIFVMNADGTGQVNITNSDTDELDPAWSPDGDRLVYSAVRGPDFGKRWELATADPDGANEVVITDAAPSYDDRGPDWAPNGDMIVWMAQYDESCCGDWDVWAMNEDGSGKTNLTDDGDPWLGDGDWFPSWSPDGTNITFSSNRITGWSFDVFAIDAPTVLPPPPAAPAAASPAASYDGARLVVRGSNATGLAWGSPATAPLTVERRGTGSGRVTSTDGAIRCGTSCSATFPAGKRVVLQAKPSPHSVFSGWLGACSGTDPRCSVTVTGATEVVARFSQMPAS